MYKVESYYDSEFRGLEDNDRFDDWSRVAEWAHEHAMKGGYVRITNEETGLDVEIDPDEYMQSEYSFDVLNGASSSLDYRIHTYKVEFYITAGKDDTTPVLTNRYVKAINEHEAIKQFNTDCDRDFGIPMPIKKVRLTLW